MARILFTLILTLITTSFNLAAYGNLITAIDRIPRIVSPVQFPQSKWRLVRHSFQINIPQGSNALSQLSIGVPQGLTVSNSISVFDKSGKIITNSISKDGKKVTISFTEPVAPGNRLKVVMKNVKITGRSNAWLYPVSAKLLGMNAAIPLGFARFRVYF